ncbi:MAG TPA: hypothetical protein VEO54_19320 [Thermoanaerobaculia bacterium]|nr:hypothetical protein [Thermoanaerobaculia bacterium]
MRSTILLFLLVALSLDAREVARVPMQMLGNRILVDVAVNDHPPSTFILDTGAARTAAALAAAGGGDWRRRTPYRT